MQPTFNDNCGNLIFVDEISMKPRPSYDQNLGPAPLTPLC